MWMVDNQTPFAAERAWVRDRDGAEVWLVAVKCTFDILPDGTTQVSEEQPPALHVPQYHGEPGKSSLKYESDFPAGKNTTDVLVVGHAYAPKGRPVTELDAGFRVGPVQKLLHITGDRTWGPLGPSSPIPFTTMPLVYERAFGGVDGESDHPERDWDGRNPVGTGFAVKRGHLANRALPNIEYPNALIRNWDDRPPPAGFGPIGPHWSPRSSFGGTYDDAWKKTRKPLLPDDFDDRFYQCAPTDQQAPHPLQGGEPVVLHRLTPEGDLRFTLPRLHLGFQTHFFDGTRVHHHSRRLHTVILEPDFPRVSLVWHTALRCHSHVLKLMRTIVIEKDVVGGARDAADDEQEAA
jgi:hypothetical protein